MKVTIVGLGFIRLPLSMQFAGRKLERAAPRCPGRSRAYKINGRTEKILLAMTIDSDRNSGGESRGSISRSYERVGKNPFVYHCVEWPFRPTVRGRRLPVQRVGTECAGFA